MITDLTLREQHSLRVMKNRVLRKMCEPVGQGNGEVEKIT
jgi:hypothetical protein